MPHRRSKNARTPTHTLCKQKDSLEKTISYATVARTVLKYTEESKHYLVCFYSPFLSHALFLCFVPPPPAPYQ